VRGLVKNGDFCLALNKLHRSAPSSTILAKQTGGADLARRQDVQDQALVGRRQSLVQANPGQDLPAERLHDDSRPRGDPDLPAVPMDLGHERMGHGELQHVAILGKQYHRVTLPGHVTFVAAGDQVVETAALQAFQGNRFEPHLGLGCVAFLGK
jgi:hypothetical protein